MQQVASPVYGERNVTLRYRVCDLLLSLIHISEPTRPY